MSIIPNKGSRKSLEFVWNFSFLIHENRIFCLFPYSKGCAYAKTRMKIAIFIRVFSFSHSFCRSCFSFSNSLSDKVMPLPIFACSGAQSRMSYLGVPPFHEILFSSFIFWIFFLFLANNTSILHLVIKIKLILHLKLSWL